MKKLIKYLRESLPVVTLTRWSKQLILPGFEGLPLYDVGDFFVRGLNQGTLSSRASAMSYSFLLAIFPSVIFLFTLIPYIPIKDFQDELLYFIRDFLPKSAYETVRDTLEDIIKHQRGGLLSVGFFSALYFSTNGIHAMMNSFNQSFHSVETRTPFKQRLVSILLTIILFLLVLTAVLMIIFSETGLRYLREHGWLKRRYTVLIFSRGKWLIILALFFIAFSFLYYFGPAKKKRFRFISAGSMLATILSVLLTLGFAFFVNNIAGYNKLYGSIGTLIVIMLWINFNSFILLLGFELNASIDNASVAHQKKNVRKFVRNAFRTKPE